MDNINETFQKAIDKKDIESIRDTLVVFITMDQGFSKGVLDKKIRYCNANGISDDELYAEFDGGTFKEDPVEWDVSYYAEQRTKLRYNFSKKRLVHLRKVGQKLFPAASSAASSFSDEAKKKYGAGETHRSGQSTKNQGGDFPPWLIPAGIGAAVLLLLWLLFGRKR
jgi:hypothetical protein